MKEQFQAILNKVLPAAQAFGRHTLTIVFLIFTILYGFFVFHINQLSSREPTDAQISSELKTVPRPKVDQQTLLRIQQLQDQNVQVKALFDQARQNPFSE